jgi:hypothetical protein
MRIKTTTYSDVQQKPCQFYWHGLLHITIALGQLTAIKDLNVLFYLELVSEVSSALIDDIRAATSSKSTFRQPHDEASFETSSGKSRASAVALSLPLSGSVEG